MKRTQARRELTRIISTVEQEISCMQQGETPWDDNRYSVLFATLNGARESLDCLYKRPTIVTADPVASQLRH